MYIQTPSKTSKAQTTVYMIPFLLIADINQDMIDTLIAIKRTVDVFSSLLPSLVSLSSEKRFELDKSVYLVVETKADYFTPRNLRRRMLFYIILPSLFLNI